MNTLYYFWFFIFISFGAERLLSISTLGVDNNSQTTLILFNKRWRKIQHTKQITKIEVSKIGY